MKHHFKQNGTVWFESRLGLIMIPINATRKESYAASTTHVINPIFKSQTPDFLTSNFFDYEWDETEIRQTDDGFLIRLDDAWYEQTENEVIRTVRWKGQVIRAQIPEVIIAIINAELKELDRRRENGFLKDHTFHKREVLDVALR